MRKITKRGQSILEYTLLLGVVIIAVVAVLFSSEGVKEKLQTTYNKTGGAIENTSNDMTVGVFK